jgi:hypothetical protein
VAKDIFAKVIENNLHDCGKVLFFFLFTQKQRNHSASFLVNYWTAISSPFDKICSPPIHQRLAPFFYRKFDIFRDKVGENISYYILLACISLYHERLNDK